LRIAYVRRFSQFVIDGNDGNFENCSTRSSFRGALCFEDEP
jgi:iron complex outermembrane receptor protein